MRLEDQVCSLELAKRLKDLGIKQDGFYCYFMMPDIDGLCYEENWKVIRSQLLPLTTAQLKCRMNSNCCISAFTVAELGDFLPKYIKAETLLPEPNDKIAKFYLCYNENGYPSYDFYENEISPGYKKENEANARAKMLIYLIENDLSPL